MKIGHAYLFLMSFCSTFYLKNWRSYDNFKIWPTFWPRDLVIWPLPYKSIGRCVGPDSICGPSLVLIGQKLRPVPCNRQTNKQTDERAIGDCVLAKICLYNVHCNGDNDNWNIVDYFDVWLVWKSIGLHVLVFCQVGWICVDLLFPSDFDVTLWHYQWRHQHQKYFSGVNFGRSFHIWCQNEPI